MSTIREVSKNQRAAVILAWNRKCAISGIGEDICPLHVDHIVPLVANGSNGFENLVPLTANLNLLKSGNRLNLPLEAMLLFLAAGKVPTCQAEYARIQHKKNPFPNDPNKIDLDTISKYIVPSKLWTMKATMLLIKSWIRYGVRRLESLARRLGKSLHSVRMKLSWFKIYNPKYRGHAA